MHISRVALLRVSQHSNRLAFSALCKNCVWEQRRKTTQHALVDTHTTDYDASIKDHYEFIALRESRLQLFEKYGKHAITDSLPERIAAENFSVTRLSLMPREIFRQELNNAGKDHTTLRRLLVTQLSHCTTPRDLKNILVMTISNPTAARVLSLLEDSISSALYRSRSTASDQEVLTVIIQYICRLRLASLPVHLQFYRMALKFGARSRELDRMRRCLKMYKGVHGNMTENLFRSIIAKCSIGYLRLGRIRNGDWNPAHLRQVLLGFHAESNLPEEQRSHLGIYLNRSSWHYLHGWVAALALAKADDCILLEWEHWKMSPWSRSPRPLAKIRGSSDTRFRGDMWFVEQMMFADNHKQAWRILRESGVSFRDLKPWVQAGLISAAHYAGHLSSEVQECMVEKYGDVVLPSGQLFREVCVLDAKDEFDNTIMSERTSAIVSAALRPIAPRARYGTFYVGSTPAAVSEAKALHEAAPIEVDGDELNGVKAI